MQRKTFQKAISLVLSLVMLLSVFSGITVIAEDTVAYEATRITIHPGIDDTYLNFSWQSDELAAPATVRIKAENSDNWMTFTGESKAFVISEDGYEEGYHDTFVKNCGHTCSAVCGHEACTASQCYHGTYTKPYYNRVTVSGLEYGVNYTYQLGDGANWSKEYSTKIADSDPDEGFSYLVFGDSQTADQYYGDYMKKALELSVDKFSDIDFLMNLGDNIHENNDRNYNAYFTSQDILAQYPIAVVLGNHELNLCTNGDRVNFSDHPTLALQNPPAADNRADHWFRYGDALFITFNSGPQQTSMMADLEQLIIDAKAAHPDTRWTVLQTHQGFYANNGGGKVWRKDFTSIISKYDIDVVFNGHHHMYTRTESLVYDATLTCSHSKSSPVFSCAACSGSVEPLGENDVTVKETYVASDHVTTTEYDKTVERVDPEGITYIHLDSLTAEGHDQYDTNAGATLASTNAFSINTVAGQGAITKVTVKKDEFKVETFWINNNGTPRVSNSKPLSLLDDDYIEDTPYDTYTIKKTAPVKEVEVTFDGGADRSIFTRKINSGEAVVKPANPVLTGKSFKYWTADGETEFDFATTLTADTVLTAVYEDIPPTTTADLFIEAVNRGDKEIILAGDITLTEVVTFNNNVTIKSVEGQKHTITLDGAARLVVAKGKKVTFDGIGVTIAATANTISDAYNDGTYITVGSGGSRADLYVYNSTIKNLLTNMGASGTGIVGSSKNASSAVRFENTVITSAVTNTSTGGAILGQYITVYATDTSMTNAKSAAWFCTSSTTVILYGKSSYVGWKHNSAKLYDFRNASVKIARNKDNFIELTKIGTGAAVTNDNYKIYYAFEDTAFADGTAIEYTEPIANVDYETPVYATIKYTGKSYYGTVANKICGEYIEGVAVSTANEFVEALANYETVITLTSDITLADLGSMTINTDAKIKSTNGNNFTITLDGSSRLVVAAGKTATIDGVNITIAATATQLTSWGQGYITVGSDNSAAKLYIKNSTINCLSSDIGTTDHAVLRADQNASSKIYIENSKITASISGNNGVLLAGSYTTYFITDSDVLAKTSADWLCTAVDLIVKGDSNYRGYKGNDHKLYDLSKAYVNATRNKDNLVELSKTGSGTAVSNNNCKIYYAFEETAFADGTAIEYTAPIADIDYVTPIYMAIRYTGTSYYSVVTQKVCPEYVEGVAVATQDELLAAIANGDSLITLTADITLSGAGEISTVANTTIQSKTGEQFTITLDGDSRIRISQGKTTTFKNVDIVVASTADIVSDGWTNGGYITVGSDNSKATLYMYNCNVECKSSDIGNTANSIIRADKNASSYIYMADSTIKAAIAVSQGALFGGANATYRFKNTTLSVSPSNAWLCTSTKFILEGTSTYTSGAWKTNDYTLADFRNVNIAAARDADNNIVLTKEGTGAAVTSDTYKIYYSTDKAAFSAGTAIAYTEAITGIDSNTPIYVAVKYGSNAWYSEVVEAQVADYVPENPTVEGATILQSPDSEGNQDIRFSYSTGKADESNPIVEYGMLITLKKFEVGELTLENAAANQDKINVSKVENVSITESGSFVASIGSVPTNLYTYTYRTVVYVKYADGSVVYSEEIERSVAGVAKSIAGYVYKNRTNEALADLAETVEGLVAGVDGEGNVTLTAEGKANNGAAVLAFLEENNEKIANAIKIIGQ